jgi:hypothetical protein
MGKGKKIEPVDKTIKVLSVIPKTVKCRKLLLKLMEECDKI